MTVGNLHMMADSKHGDGVVDENDPDDAGPCKWGPLQPPCCQKFRNPKWVLFWLCWAGALQGLVVSGFVNVIITTIEKRFEISSTESGTIVSCYDIASAICLLPVSYFGGHGIKPRYIGIGVLTLGLGSFLFSLPHFTTGLYTFESSNENLCNVGANATTSCDTGSTYSSISNYKYVFIVAQLLHGAGASPFYTLGVTYLDENLPLRSSSLYNGIFYAMVIIGTAVGYLAGGEFLNIWTDVGAVDTANLAITTANRRWVGAWWLGFVFAGCIAFLVAFPICGFPKYLPGYSKYQEEKEAEMNVSKRQDGKKHHGNGDVTGSTEKQGTGSKKFSLKEIWNSTKILLTNPTFMFLNLVGATEANVVGGFSAFAPKFLEYQFSLPAARAAQYVGLAAIPAGGGGTLLGGWLVKRFDLKVPGILKACLASTITVVILAFIFLVNCDNVPFAGINTEYLNSTSSVTKTFLGKQLDNQCNADCGCTEEDYQPVCGKDEIMYFSPCYAGCEVIQYGDVTRYTNCSCITTNATDYMAEFTSCESSCIWLPAFLPVFALMMFLTFLVSMPSLTATLRCVPDDQRSFALGIQWLIVRCLGAIPGPIIFGKMFDLSCLLWQQRCDGEGTCFFYNNQNMSYYLMAVGMTVKAFSTLFFFLALVFYKKPPTVEKGTAIDVSKPDVSSSGSKRHPTGKDNPAFDASDEASSDEPKSTSYTCRL